MKKVFIFLFCIIQLLSIVSQDTKVIHQLVIEPNSEFVLDRNTQVFTIQRVIFHNNSILRIPNDGKTTTLTIHEIETTGNLALIILSVESTNIAKAPSGGIGETGDAEWKKNGGSGINGSNGVKGKNGRNIEINIGPTHLNGSFGIVSIGGKGQDGGSGGQGGRGGQAPCSNPGVHSTNGGRGGNGGNGGDGGNPGIVTIYYSTITYKSESISIVDIDQSLCIVDDEIDDVENIVKYCVMKEKGFFVFSFGGKPGVGGDPGPSGLAGKSKKCWWGRHGAGKSGSPGSPGFKGDRPRMVPSKKIPLAKN